MFFHDDKLNLTSSESACRHLTEIKFKTTHRSDFDIFYFIMMKTSRRSSDVSNSVPP